MIPCDSNVLRESQYGCEYHVRVVFFKWTGLETRYAALDRMSACSKIILLYSTEQIRDFGEHECNDTDASEGD